jgi:hypothetical protein
MHIMGITARVVVCPQLNVFQFILARVVKAACALGPERRTRALEYFKAPILFVGMCLVQLLHRHLQKPRHGQHLRRAACAVADVGQNDNCPYQVQYCGDRAGTAGITLEVLRGPGSVGITLVV